LWLFGNPYILFPGKVEVLFWFFSKTARRLTLSRTSCPAVRLGLGHDHIVVGIL